MDRRRGRERKEVEGGQRYRFCMGLQNELEK